MNAPEKVKFLRDPHRHEFHVTLTMEVSHDNRDIEFIQLKEQLDGYLRVNWENSSSGNSCEQVAKHILNYFDAYSVSVSEDGENGATVVTNKLLPKQEEKVEKEVVSVLPSQLIRTKPFIGIEAEGPNRRKKTLFIPGCVEVEDYRAFLRGGEKDLYVYLGAGNIPISSLDIATKLLAARKYYEDISITMEVDSLSLALHLIPPGCGVSFISNTIEDWDILPIGSAIKIVTKDKVHLIYKNARCYTTNLDDPLYAQDKEII